MVSVVSEATYVRWPVNLRKLSHFVATLGFFLLFPGFFIYHFLLAVELIPAFLGGLFGNVAAAMVLFCIAVSYWLLRERAWGGFHASRLFLLTWSYCAVWAAVGALTVVGEPHGFLATREAVAMLVIWVAMFFVGSFVKLDTAAMRAILMTLCVSMVGLLVAAVVIHQSLLGPFLVFSPSTDSDAASSTYQGAGRSVLITGIVASALIRGVWKQFGVLVVTVLVLLSLGSRTYLLAGGSCLVLTVLLAAARNRHYVAALIFGVALAAAAYGAQEFFFQTRARELFDLAQSSSWQMRLTLQQNAIEKILSNPLIGDFAYHIREISAGAYAHNVLSAWTEYGAIGFCLYVSLIVVFFLTAIRHIFSENPLWHTAVALNVVTLIIVMAEPVFSVVPALGWGFVVNALLDERRRRKPLVLEGRV